MNRKHWVIITVVLLLTLAACGTDTGTTGAPVATQAATSAPASPTATPKPTQAPKWTTVQHFSGNGDKKTAIFTVPNDWKIVYSCVGGDYGAYLSATIYDSNAGYVDGAVNTACKAGNKATTGETEEHQAGSFYLDILGSDQWTIAVQVLK